MRGGLLLIDQWLRITSADGDLHGGGFAAAGRAIKNHRISGIRPAKEMARGAGACELARAGAVGVHHPDFQTTAVVPLDRGGGRGTGYGEGLEKRTGSR